ncbi:Protein PLANT CADMIUM RESISTANCE 6 [Acorus calamus]|uniref:Protein PLANT CADMIUM RESISTANCE 6 n=1 Tax=Acorus calamus TaxID=4465 RepID=A0AAV9E8G7_ACOCL|nr:Protein PLANT CADMIUM RESISTANCE 6 [Acorus calamus]
MTRPQGDSQTPPPPPTHHRSPPQPPEENYTTTHHYNSAHESYETPHPPSPPPAQFPPQTVHQQQQHYHQNNVAPSTHHAPNYSTQIYTHAIPSPYTTYVVQTPPVPQLHVGNSGTTAWTTGLFDCRDDPNNALVTLCFPCVTFGQIAEIIDSGHSSCGTSGFMYGMVSFCIALPCLLSYSYRTKLRARYNLVETPAPDCLTHFFCECCALSQEYRELRNRGLDPDIGDSLTSYVSVSSVSNNSTNTLDKIRFDNFDYKKI